MIMIVHWEDVQIKVFQVQIPFYIKYNCAYLISTNYLFAYVMFIL